MLLLLLFLSGRAAGARAAWEGRGSAPPFLGGGIAAEKRWP